jgi:PleD family two-component response regulator
MFAVGGVVDSPNPEDQTCSAGVCRWDGAESAESLTVRADTALYAAKDAGRDRVVGS